MFKVKESTVRRRYSDFKWLRSELERDSKVIEKLKKTCTELRCIWWIYIHFVSIFSNVIDGIVTCNYHVRLLSRCLSTHLTFKVKLFILLMAIFQIVVPALPGDALKKQLPFRGDDGRTLSSRSKIYSRKHIGFVHSIFPSLNTH